MLHDLWSILLNLQRVELRLRDGRRYLRKYRQLLKQVEDWSESSGICHLLPDARPMYWKRGMEDMTVRIMSPGDQYPRVMEYFRRNLGEPDWMMSMKNSVYMEVVWDTAGGRLLRGQQR